MLAEKCFPSLLPVRSGAHLEAGIGENDGYQLANSFLVVGHKDSSLRSRKLRL